MPTEPEKSPEPLGRRGRVPSGESRSDIEKRSAKKLRDKRYESGLVDLKTYVTAETREHLLSLKKELGVSNLGEVVEELLKNYKNTSINS